MSSSFATRLVLLLGVMGLCAWLALQRQRTVGSASAAPRGAALEPGAVSAPSSPSSPARDVLDPEFQRKLEQLQKQGIQPACRTGDPLCDAPPQPP